MNKLSTINCVHFGPCGGCTLNNPNSPLIWELVKEFFDEHEAPLSDLQIGAITGWRTKAKLAVRGTDKPLIGLFRAGSHNVLPIPHCQIHHPAINQAVAIVESAITREKISIYDEKSGKGLLRYIQCFVELGSGHVQLSLMLQSEDPSIDRLCKLLEENDLFHSIWLNIQAGATNTIMGERWVHICGPQFLQQTISGKTFLFHPGAFSQAHWTLFEKLAVDVVAMVPDKAKLLEIYAGIGAMGILAADKCTTVDLIEYNSLAHQSFKAMDLPIPYHLGDAQLAIDLLPHADCFLLDPPRKGVDPLLLNNLLWVNGTIIYVSCDFKSFIRDAEDLIEGGWILKEGRGYLLFPGTNHVEIVARFIKGVD